ncbi:MAG: hypothetical protein WC606_04605 [Candidatus Absconditabacterales bacterium]|jgi:hypothetical protein
MNEMKYVSWTLETLTNTKRITTEELLELDLKDRQVHIYPNADNLVGASMIGERAYTSNEFPMIGDSGIIQMVDDQEEGISFRCLDLFKKQRFFTPKHTDIVFIIEKGTPGKGNWLKPEFAWRPEC